MVESVTAKVTAKSWQTTLAGLVAALCLSGPEIAKAFDGNDATVTNWMAVIGALAVGALGGAARDNGKSSEQVGAKGPEGTGK